MIKKVDSEEYNLEKKINDTVKSVCKLLFPTSTQYFELRMQDFIEKMACWYEIIYPVNEVERIMNNKSNDIHDLEDKKAFMVNDSNLDKQNALSGILWSDFFNYEFFEKLLDSTEKSFLELPKYEKTYSVIKSDDVNITVITNETKEIVNVKYDNEVSKDLKDIFCKSNNIYELLEYLENSDLEESDYKFFKTIVNGYKNQIYKREKILDCVMYKIIERGFYMGAKRAFLFAEEFNRNIDIPMIYGIDTLDENIENFINEYIKSGGSENLECLVDYYYDQPKNEVKTIKEILKDLNSVKRQDKKNILSIQN